MSDNQRFADAARLLLEQHRARIAFGPLPDRLAPRSVEDAYAIQEALRRLRAATLGPVAGHKVALTSTVMQKMVGFDSPFAGPLHSAIIHRSPAKLRLADYIHLGIECELAATLGADLPAMKAPYTRSQVAEAVDTLMPAFELVDDRYTDYTQISSLILTLIADNAWNAGIVLGAPVRNWHSLDLAAIRGVLKLNGAVAGEGYGRDVLGHPFDALAWLINTLAGQGRSMTKGMVVMTGSMIATQFVSPGDALNFSLDDLGELSVRLE